MIKKKVHGCFIRERVLLEKCSGASLLFHKHGYGGKLEDKSIQLSLYEALYLLEKNKISIKDGRKKLNLDTLREKGTDLEPKFWIKYCVFKDMRDRGYTLKTALKFGADFRVYERGIKPGDDHAKWILYAVHESESLTWHEFAAKNRVAHSTKKRLTIGIVDDEGDITYYECKWIKP